MTMIRTLVLACTAVAGATASWVHREGALSHQSKQEQKLELTFGLTHPEESVKQLERELLDRSSPSSASYGQWLSNEQVHAILTPRDEDVKAVEEHLKAHGVTDLSYSLNKDWIMATVTVEVAERILGAEYDLWTHPEAPSVTRLHPAHSVQLPPRVARAVAIVEPTRRMPPVSKWLSVLDQQPLLGNTPANLRDLYNVTGVGSGDQVNPTGHAVTAFIGQYYSANDFQTFWNRYGAATGVSLPPVNLVGDATNGRGGVESMLDIEYINAMAAGVKTSFWGFAGTAPDNKQNEPFLKWLIEMGQTSDADVPKIFSSSYGENEDSTTLPNAQRMNTEFMKAGARGITLLFASGDEGANCKNGVYVPEWPSSSPYVTAVGGTTQRNPEHAVGLSSGGFSNRWPMPEYQKSAVSAYLTRGQADPATFPPDALYNASGRAYPDVSAQATGYMVYAGGLLQPGVAGTSCACPTFAGVVALLVDRRLAAGKTSLGFLNPLIYASTNGLTGAMTDITVGHNTGCLFGEGHGGWPALEGWDAATGFGTPNYGRMLDVVLSLP